jgi:hypothetical protein
MNLNHNHYICLWSFFKSDCLNWSADDVPSSNTEESNPLFIGLKPDSIYYLSGSCPDRVVKFSTCFLIRVKFQCLPKSNITVGLIWVNLGWFSFRMIVEEKTWNILLFIYSYKPTTIMNRGHCFWTFKSLHENVLHSHEPKYTFRIRFQNSAFNLGSNRNP